VVGVVVAGSTEKACVNWVMESIEKDVVRLKNPGEYHRRPLPHSGVTSLPQPIDSTLLFSEVIRKRRSAGSFPPITYVDLSNFLYGVASVRQVNHLDRNLQRRYVASMGALHPAHLVIRHPEGHWSTYLPGLHALGGVQINRDSADALLTLVRQHKSCETATIICLLSDCDLAANYYENFESLILRDAGVLLGHASLVAAAYDLTFCILGRTGGQFVETLIQDLPFKAGASGLALLGGPEGRAVE
jgi:hypothetical protein